MEPLCHVDNGLTTFRDWLCFKIELYGPKPSYLRQFPSLRFGVQHW